jgi:hypothetical protein
MALPIIETPRYELTLPSADIKIQYRPFIVKEEKVLLMSMENQNSDETLVALKEILRACTFDKVKIEDLPMFDIEYLFLQIRSKSVGEIAKFKVLCPDDKKTFVDVEVDISKIEVQVDDSHTNNIMLDEKRKLGLVMKYPTIDFAKAGLDVNMQDIDKVFEIITSCIDHIYEGEKIYPAKDTTKEELRDFIEKLSQKSFENIKTFFESMPQLRHEIEVENPNTKVKNKIVFKGIQDFFQSASPTVA